MDKTAEAMLLLRITQLESRVDALVGELARAVQLIDRYGVTLGEHLKRVIADQAKLSERLNARVGTGVQSS